MEAITTLPRSQQCEFVHGEKAGGRSNLLWPLYQTNTNSYRTRDSRTKGTGHRQRAQLYFLYTLPPFFAHTDRTSFSPKRWAGNSVL